MAKPKAIEPFCGGDGVDVADPARGISRFRIRTSFGQNGAAFGASGSHAFELAPLHSGARQPGDERQL